MNHSSNVCLCVLCLVWENQEVTVLITFGKLRAYTRITLKLRVLYNFIEVLHTTLLYCTFCLLLIAYHHISVSTRIYVSILYN